MTLELLKGKIHRATVIQRHTQFLENQEVE